MDQLGEPRQFAVALDPFRPGETTAAPGTVPPSCPSCESLIYHVRSNDHGDLLFECLLDGYQAVYRIGSRRWEPNPNAQWPNWEAPFFGARQPTEPVAAPPRVAPAPPPVAPAPAAVAPVELPPVTGPVVLPAPSTTTASVARTASTDDIIEWLTLADAAAIAGKTQDAIYRRVRRKTLDAKKDGAGRVIVRADQLLGDEPEGPA